MTKIEALNHEIEKLKELARRMDARIREMEAGQSTTPAPPCQGGEFEATDDDLIYILRTHGEEAYRKALRARNKIRAARDKYNAPRPPLTLSGGAERRSA